MKSRTSVAEYQLKYQGHNKRVIVTPTGEEVEWNDRRVVGELTILQHRIEVLQLQAAELHERLAELELKGV